MGFRVHFIGSLVRFIASRVHFIEPLLVLMASFDSLMKARDKIVMTLALQIETLANTAFFLG